MAENSPRGTNWVEIPAVGSAEGRGMGALDMARTLRSGGRPSAAADLALHVLDAMESINSSAASGATARLSTTCASSDLLPPGAGTRCGSRPRFYAEALVPGACGWKAVGTTASTPKTWPRVDHRPTRLQALVNPTNVINAVQTFYPPVKHFARFSAIHGGKTGPPALLAGLNKTIANLSATPMKAGNPCDRVFQLGLRP